jgi:hypothetical protein
MGIDRIGGIEIWEYGDTVLNVGRALIVSSHTLSFSRRRLGDPEYVISS